MNTATAVDAMFTRREPASTTHGSIPTQSRRHDTPAATDANAIELETVACPSCGGRDHQPVISASDPVTKIGGVFHVVRCCHCALAFTNPRPTEQSIGLFYPDSYGPYSGRDGDENLSGRWRHVLTQAALRSGFGYPPQPLRLSTRLLAGIARLAMRRTRQRQSWIPFRAPGRLLDFGCGAGDFLKRMRAFGWSVEGIDMSEKVACDVEQSAGIRVHVGSLPHPEIHTASFDAVTMWNSLEHVHQPRAVVQAAWQALRPGGLLVVGVPNFEACSFRWFRENWYALELPRHLTHFTPATLGALVEREGFQVHSLDQIARAGCLRKSARRATAAGAGPWWTRAMRYKPWGLLAADWTERTGRADFMRLIAEKA
jgi:SAM-dependent methyltransferase